MMTKNNNENGLYAETSEIENPLLRSPDNRNNVIESQLRLLKLLNYITYNQKPCNEQTYLEDEQIIN